ncbi:MAG: class I SAM-dependent RNA methyltransferase [Clostridia bacterium]|nr:class I SAM-dependent RNA methyltransferase [Clostridia bacterium]
MKLCVTSASGIEAVTKRELNKITGIEDLAAVNGRIVFEGGWKEISACNYLLRTGNRVEIIVGEFKAENFDDLFEGIRNIPWEEFIDINGKPVVTAKSVQSKIFALSAVQSVVKKAVCVRLQEKYGITTLPEDGARYKIETAFLKDFVTVTLDTSGEGLHRRGYRGLVGEAPLKETLASALVQLSVWKASRPLADPFCGSGTIPIEACLIAKNIPSGINRTFDFLSWKCADRSVFDQIKGEADANIDLENEVKIMGFDIDEGQLKLARAHARLAGVEQYIHFQRADAAEFTSSKKYGVIITNPPYGERLSDRKGIEKTYRAFGKAFSGLENWSCYTLTAVTDFERLFGKRADKTRKLYNGKIECRYYAMLGEKPPRP